MIDVSLAQRCFFGLVSLGSLVFLGALVYRRLLEIRYAIVWLPPFLAGFVLSVMPESLLIFSRLLGFHVASNALLSLALLGLIYVALLQTLALARAKKDIRRLAQEVALRLPARSTTQEESR